MRLKNKELIKIIFLFISAFSFSCSNNTSSNHFTKPDNLSQGILGKWGGLGENRPVWEIKADSIYYFQENKAYPYKMNGNDLIIERPDGVVILKNIAVDVDTLMFYHEQGLKVKAYRFR